MREDDPATTSVDSLLLADHPEITSLTVTSNGVPVSHTSPASRHYTVTVTCIWDEGCPSQTALLKKDGTEFGSSSDRPYDEKRNGSLRHIDYVIQHVHCSDSGLITCEAAGARRNKSLMLVVRCESRDNTTHTNSLSLSLSNSLSVGRSLSLSLWTACTGLPQV